MVVVTVTEITMLIRGWRLACRMGGEGRLQRLKLATKSLLVDLRPPPHTTPPPYVLLEPLGVEQAERRLGHQRHVEPRSVDAVTGRRVNTAFPDRQCRSSPTHNRNPLLNRQWVSAKVPGVVCDETAVGSPVRLRMSEDLPAPVSPAGG